MPAGRPSDYTEEIGLKICEIISTSNKSIRTIAKELDLNVSTIIYWLAHIEKFSVQYAKAKEMQADYLVEEMLEIADDSSKDIIHTEDGKEIENREFTSRSRLRVDTRKWIASKLKPKKYAENIKLSGDTENPVIVAKLTPEQFEEKLRTANKILGIED